MHIPTIYKKNIDLINEPLIIDDDKLHHLNNVLRVKNNSPVKVSNGEGRGGKTTATAG